jgi:predicted RNase H-like nuclease
VNYFGIDGCRSGWFYVQLDDNHNFQIGVLSSIVDLLDIAQSTDIVLLDIPIGLSESGKDERTCDKEARQLLKPKRSSSVFPSPCRPALYADSYSQGSAINYQNTGRKLSQQSWAIASKIKEVDEFVINYPSKVAIREMHPEICFWSLNERLPLDHAKKKKEGFEERLNLLSKHFKPTGAIVEKAMSEFLRKELARDDVLDALVGAVMAMHPLKSIPGTPVFDDKGIRMEMVYAEL